MENASLRLSGCQPFHLQVGLRGLRGHYLGLHTIICGPEIFGLWFRYRDFNHVRGIHQRLNPHTDGLSGRQNQ